MKVVFADAGYFIANFFLGGDYTRVPSLNGSMAASFSPFGAEVIAG